MTYTKTRKGLGFYEEAEGARAGNNPDQLEMPLITGWTNNDTREYKRKGLPVKKDGAESEQCLHSCWFTDVVDIAGNNLIDMLVRLLTAKEIGSILPKEAAVCRQTPVFAWGTCELQVLFYTFLGH